MRAAPLRPCNAELGTKRTLTVLRRHRKASLAPSETPERRDRAPCGAVQKHTRPTPAPRHGTRSQTVVRVGTIFQECSLGPVRAALPRYAGAGGTVGHANSTAAVARAAPWQPPLGHAYPARARPATAHVIPVRQVAAALTLNSAGGPGGAGDADQFKRVPNNLPPGAELPPSRQHMGGRGDATRDWARCKKGLPRAHRKEA